MPGINHGALDAALNLALDILETKVGEEFVVNMKDQKMKFKRVE